MKSCCWDTQLKTLYFKINTCVLSQSVASVRIVFPIKQTYLQLFWGKYLWFQQMALNKPNIFLCSHMPYPKKTNMLEIWSLQTQAIVVGVGMGVCVCVLVCARTRLSLCLPFLLSKALMRTDTAAAKFILMQSENIKLIQRIGSIGAIRIAVGVQYISIYNPNVVVVFKHVYRKIHIKYFFVSYLFPASHKPCEKILCMHVNDKYIFHTS